MFFVASATIAGKHPELEEAVRDLDEHLFRWVGHPLRADFTSELLGIERGRLARLMALFVEQGVAEKLVGYVCPGCDGLIEHVPNEGDLWCDECEESVSLRGRGDLGVVMWQTRPTAATTDRANSGPAVESPATPDRLPACIQFVGGDRGGGTRNLLMIPREEKTIHDAVNAGRYRHGFTFARPVYAASIDDLIACSLSLPRIVHLAGHGEDRRLVVTRDRDLVAATETLTLEQVDALFRNFTQRVTLVFFNTCHSAGLARELARSAAVEVAIGVPGLITDDKAIAFARSFYRQLAEGVSVRRAFDMAGVHHGSAVETVRHEVFAADGIDTAGLSFTG